MRNSNGKFAGGKSGCELWGSVARAVIAGVSRAYNPPMKTLAMASLTAWACSESVRAEVYRCVVHGRITYTDVACGAAAAPAVLPQLSTVQAGPRADLAKQYDEDAARHNAAVRKARAADADEYTAKKSQAEAIRKGVVENRVVPGMTTTQVERILNLPTQIDGQGGPHERWVYKNGRDQRTVIFKDGIVASEKTGTSRKQK